MLLFSSLLILSTFFSKFTLTLSMIGLFALSIYALLKHPKGARRHWQRQLQNPHVIAMAALIIVFLITFVSGLWSENTAYWLSRVRIKMPYLFMVVAFMILPPLRRRDLHLLLNVLIWTAAFSALWIVLYSWWGMEADVRIDRGKSLPTPGSHIRYSLLVSIANIAAFSLAYYGRVLRYRWETIALWCAAIFLLAFQHYLAVRSGWVTTYAGLLLIFFMIAYRKKKKRWITIGVLLMILGPLGAYQWVDNFRDKVNYTLADLRQYQKGEGYSYSDATRFRSIEVGWQLFLEAPLLGVGAGDLKDLSREKFQKLYPKSSKYILPHNQYISFLAEFGLIGFILLLAAFLQPLLGGRWKRSIVFLHVQLTFALSCLVENTLESAVGVSIFLMLTLFYLSYFKGNPRDETFL